MVEEKLKPEVTNEDCMVMMERYPDNFFDLAVVDPPYREKNEPDQWMRAKGGKMKNFGAVPDEKYFQELNRVAKEFICWGGNYFTDLLEPNNNWIIWYKMNDGVHFSMAEMAYSTIRKNVKVFHHWHNGAPNKIHTTQKPIALYRWILHNYAEPGQKILDTHLGSGSSRIAAYKENLPFWACELDKDYFKKQEERFQKEKDIVDQNKQMMLW